MIEEVMTKDNKLFLVSSIIGTNGLPYITTTVSNIVREQLPDFERALHDAIANYDFSDEYGYGEEPLFISLVTDIDVDTKEIYKDSVVFIRLDIDKQKEHKEFRDILEKMKTTKFSDLDKESQQYLLEILNIRSLV